jgi:hypothetical protein
MEQRDGWDNELVYSSDSETSETLTRETIRRLPNFPIPFSYRYKPISSAITHEECEDNRNPDLIRASSRDRPLIPQVIHEHPLEETIESNKDKHSKSDISDSQAQGETARFNEPDSQQEQVDGLVDDLYNAYKYEKRIPIDVLGKLPKDSLRKVVEKLMYDKMTQQEVVSNDKISLFYEDERRGLESIGISTIGARKREPSLFTRHMRGIDNVSPIEKEESIEEQSPLPEAVRKLATLEQDTISTYEDVISQTMENRILEGYLYDKDFDKNILNITKAMKHAISAVRKENNTLKTQLGETENRASGRSKLCILREMCGGDIRTEMISNLVKMHSKGKTEELQDYAASLVTEHEIVDIARQIVQQIKNLEESCVSLKKQLFELKLTSLHNEKNFFKLLSDKGRVDFQNSKLQQQISDLESTKRKEKVKNILKLRPQAPKTVKSARESKESLLSKLHGKALYVRAISKT